MYFLIVGWPLPLLWKWMRTLMWAQVVLVLAARTIVQPIYHKGIRMQQRSRAWKSRPRESRPWSLLSPSGSIMLRECQASSPQKGAVGHLLLSAALAQSRGSVTPLHQNSCGTALVLYLCDVKGKEMDTSVRSGVRPPQPSPDHRCVSTLVPSHVGSAALCWSHAHCH